MPQPPKPKSKWDLQPLEEDKYDLQPLEEPEAEDKSLLQKWDELSINQPITHAPTQAADWLRKHETNYDLAHQKLNEYVPGLGTATAMATGFGRGALEGGARFAESMLTPFNIATLGAFKGASVLGAGARAAAEAGELSSAARQIAAARTATRAGKVLSAPIAAAGAARIGSGVTDEKGVDWGKVAQGTLEVAGGGLGIVSEMPRVTRAATFEPPKVTVEEQPYPSRRLLGGEGEPTVVEGEPVSPGPDRDAGVKFSTKAEADTATTSEPLPPGVSLSPDGQTITIHAPDKAVTAILRNRGWVNVPGTLTMVRGAATATAEKPLTAFEIAMRKKAAEARAKDAEITAEDVITVPNEQATDEFLDNISTDYKPIHKTDTHTFFKRFISDDEGTFDPQQMWQNLRKLLGREPTPEEVQQGMDRQVKPGEGVGRVAQFEPKGLRESLSTDELLQYLNSPSIEPELRTQIENLLRTRGVAPNPDDAPPINRGSLYEGWNWGAEGVPEAPRQSLEDVKIPGAIGNYEVIRTKGGFTVIDKGNNQEIATYDTPEGADAFVRQYSQTPPTTDVAGLRQSNLRLVPPQRMESENSPETPFQPTPYEQEVADLHEKARQMGINPEDFSSAGELADAINIGDPGAFNRFFGKSQESDVPPDMRQDLVSPEFTVEDLRNGQIEGLDVGRMRQQNTLGPREVEDQFGPQQPWDDISFERAKPTREQMQATDEGYAVLPPGYKGPFDNHVVIRTLPDGSRVIDPARTVGGTLYSPEVSPKTPQEMRDALRAERLGRRDEPSFAKVKGGGLVIDTENKRAVINITKDYTSELSAIMAREGLQNAMDAADALGTGGEVKIRINSNVGMKDEPHSIEIYDNGSGMDETTLAEKLARLFASGKENEAGATGGKGIGSASYIAGGAHFEIDTIAVDGTDGIKYRIKAGGTPEQFQDPVKGSDWEKTPVSPDTPTGTTIKVTLKPDQEAYYSKKITEKIIKYSRNRSSKITYDQHGIMTRNVPISEISEENGAVEYSFGSTKDDKVIGDFTYKNSDIKVQLPPFDPKEERSYIGIQYLNNGMYQFSEDFSIGKEVDGVPENVIVDIHPLVDEMHGDYPFINTREDVKKNVREVINKYIKEHISGPAVERRKNRTQELYDSMPEVHISGTKRKTVIFDPGNRLTQAETNFLTNHPVVHELVRHYDELIDDIINSTGRDKWADRVEGIGLVLDDNMHGVHIPNPSTGKSIILINPFLRMVLGFSPRNNALANTTTNLHEAGHIGDESGQPINWKPSDLSDPRIGEYVASYMNQLIIHGDTGYSDTGHGMGFVHRLGEVYAAFGPQRYFEAVDRVEKIFTGGQKSGGYSPKIQELLQLYTESRGRAATTEDLLSGTGVKQSNRGRTGAGPVSGNNPTTGGGTSVWGKIKEKTGWGQGTREEAKQFSYFREALEIPSALTTTLDVSYPGRQGLPQILTPEFWKAVPKMFGSISPKIFDKIHADLKAKPIATSPGVLPSGKVRPSLLQEMGIKIFEPAATATPSKRAENMASKWVETGGTIPYVSAAWRHSIGYPIRASNRMFLTMGNVLRVNRAEKMVKLMQGMSMKGLGTGRAPMPGLLGGIHLSQGRNIGFTHKVTTQQAVDLDPSLNLQLARELGDLINTVTSVAPQRTHLLPFKQAEFNVENPKNVLEKSAAALSKLLFSPGMFWSRMRLLNPSTYAMASPFVRKQYMKAALSTLAAWYVFTEMLKNSVEDVEVNNDPTNADFGKTRVGNLRLDVSAGHIPFLVAFARLYHGGATSSETGEYHAFGEGYQAQTQESMAERFFVNKMKPVPKFIYDFLSATEHKPFHVGDRTIQLFVALAEQDLYEVAKEDPSLLPKLAAPIMLGAGSQVYDKGEAVSKFLDPEHDWVYEGGGLRDIMPWNWGADESRDFPWSEE